MGIFTSMPLLRPAFLLSCLAVAAGTPLTGKHRYMGRRWGSSPSSPSPPDIPTPAPTAYNPQTRLLNSDGVWTTGTTYSTVDAKVGDTVVFKYNSYHNVYSMASGTAYNSCDFTGATEVASTSLGGGSGSYANQYSYSCAAPGTAYLACQVGSHCTAGQKVTISCGDPYSTTSSGSPTGAGARLNLGTTAAAVSVAAALLAWVR